MDGVATETMNAPKHKNTVYIQSFGIQNQTQEKFM